MSAPYFSAMSMAPTTLPCDLDIATPPFWHHALGEEAGDGLVVLDEAEVAHDFAAEARVEQVQNGVSDAADILVDGKPVGDFRGIERRFAIVRVAVAIEIPGGIDEGVHRVGFAARGAAAFRADRVDEFGSRGERRFAFAGEFGIGRQKDGQICRRGREPCRLSRNRSRGSACPNSAGARCPNREADSRFRRVRSPLASASAVIFAMACSTERPV